MIHPLPPQPVFVQLQGNTGLLSIPGIALMRESSQLVPYRCFPDVPGMLERPLCLNGS